MADRKRPGGVGTDSSASKAAKAQRAGASGAQKAGEAPGTSKPSPRTAKQRVQTHEHEPTVRKGYEAAENPEAQGDGDPGPDAGSDTQQVPGDRDPQQSA